MISTAPMLWMYLMLAAAGPEAPAAVSDQQEGAGGTTLLATGAERDPEAIAALEKMGAHLRTLTTFAVRGVGTTEEALSTGQTIQYPGSIDLLATRPNRLRANVFSTRKRREYFYDGKTFTVFSPRQGFFAVVDAPPTIKELLDTASERLDIVLPLTDLFELGYDPALTARITSGFFVGTDVVGEHVCNHFAFRQPGVDWQIWIRDGAVPLPCKWVITGTEDSNHLDYEMEFTWDLKPTVPKDAFTFVPPVGADRIALAAIKR